jgi:hypothetical protein
MAKELIKKIESIELVKLERRFNSDIKYKYFYNIKIEKIDELLILESNYEVPSSIIGSKIKYKLDPNTNEITHFELI